VGIPWTLFRKAALLLFGISLLTGFVSTALFIGGRQPIETWTIIFTLAPVLLTITSTVSTPGVLLPNITDPHPGFLSDDPRPHILLLLGGVIAALTYFWCIFYYGKLTNAIWFGWMPVGVVAIALSLVLFAFVRRIDWYNNRFRHRLGASVRSHRNLTQTTCPCVGQGRAQQVRPFRGHVAIWPSSNGCAPWRGGVRG